MRIDDASVLEALQALEGGGGGVEGDACSLVLIGCGICMCRDELSRITRTDLDG